MQAVRITNLAGRASLLARPVGGQLVDRREHLAQHRRRAARAARLQQRADLLLLDGAGAIEVERVEPADELPLLGRGQLPVGAAVVLAEPQLHLALPQPALRGAHLLRRGRALPIERDLLLQAPVDLGLAREARDVQRRRAHKNGVLLQHREAARGREQAAGGRLTVPRSDGNF